MGTKKLVEGIGNDNKKGLEYAKFKYFFNKTH